MQVVLNRIANQHWSWLFAGAIVGSLLCGANGAELEVPEYMPEQGASLNECAANWNCKRLKLRITSAYQAGENPEHVVEFVDGNRVVYSFITHLHTVFDVSDEQLYFVRFHPLESGGAVVAVDLTTGLQRFETTLQALGMIDHSIFSTSFRIKRVGRSVIVYGQEPRGRYLEMFDVDTGKLTSHAEERGKTKRGGKVSRLN